MKKLSLFLVLCVIIMPFSAFGVILVSEDFESGYTYPDNLGAPQGTSLYDAHGGVWDIAIFKYDSTE